MRLENWYVTSRDSAYTPPEMRTISLRGQVYGHPRFEDGIYVTTSRIEEASGKTIKTESGSVYELGEVSRAYREWLRENRPNWDPENPITIR